MLVIAARTHVDYVEMYVDGVSLLSEELQE